MTNSKIFSAFFFATIFAINTTFAGGGWPQPKDQGYFKVFQWWVIGDQHFTDSGALDPNVTSGIFNSGFYGEYGLTNRLTAIAYVPFFSRATSNNVVSGTTGETITEGDAINSFGDSELGLKYGLITKGPIALSATIRFGLPLGNSNGGKAGNLQTGDGEFNQSLTVDAGKGFNIGKTEAYANIYGGYNNRSNGFSDEILYGGEIGVKLLDNKILAIARFVGVKSTNNGTSQEQSNSTSIFANNSEHFSFNPEVAYNFNDSWGVSASVGAALYGRLIFANPSYSVGVFFNFK